MNINNEALMRGKKGFTILEIIVVVVVLAVFALFSIPVFFTPEEQKQDASVRANVRMAASAITSKFALKKGVKAEEIAILVAEKLNKNTKNPIERNFRAYSVNEVLAAGTVVFVPNNQAKLVEIKGYGKNTEEPLETKIIYAPEGY